MMSGAPCPVELMKRVLTEMHIGELVIAYGQTGDLACDHDVRRRRLD